METNPDFNTVVPWFALYLHSKNVVGLFSALFVFALEFEFLTQSVWVPATNNIHVRLIVRQCEYLFVALTLG